MNAPPQSLEPILTADLFPKIESLLLDLPRSLSPSDWSAQTIASKWRVKEVVAHLLDTELRRLSFGRDRAALEAPEIKSDTDRVAFINRLNEEGVRMYSRLSPQVLASLVELASAQLSDYVSSLDPFTTASIGVSWAGEDRSLNWFDTAREYTERWHHQQQIRLAVDHPGIMTPELYHPVLDCFMRALPFRYRDITAEEGSLLQFNISGDCGGSWYLYRDSGSWRLISEPAGERVSEVTIPEAIAWRVFTKGIDVHSAAAGTTIAGDANLGLHILGMKSIVG